MPGLPIKMIALNFTVTICCLLLTSYANVSRLHEAKYQTIDKNPSVNISAYHQITRGNLITPDHSPSVIGIGEELMNAGRFSGHWVVKDPMDNSPFNLPPSEK